MSPVISLDVLPADFPAEYAPAMVSACSNALASGHCALAAQLPESERPDAVALVLFQSEAYLQVTVRVGRGDGQWTTRAISFSEHDSISERFTTIGLTVGTLVGETSAQPALPVEQPVSPPKPVAAPKPERDSKVDDTAAAVVPARWLRAQLGYTTGPGWDGGGWQRGGFLSVTLQVPETPWLLVAAGSYASSSGPELQGEALDGRWVTGAIGAGAAGTLSALRLRGSAALELGLRRLWVERAGRGAGDWETPLRVRALATFPSDGRLGFTAGGLIRVLPLGEAGDETHLTAGFEGELLAGLEVRL